MIVNHNGDTFRVIFKHTTGQWFNLKTRKTEERKVTICDIEVREVFPAEAWIHVSRGSAWCSPQDPYCKETGRKLSLTEALKKAFAYRPTRKIFWEEYGKQTKKSWFQPYAALYPKMRSVRQGRIPEENLSPGLVVPGLLQQGES